MNLETALTPTLEETLSSILISLANFFGTTTETVMANAPAWLAKYGWYITLTEKIPSKFVGFLFIMTIVSVIGFALWAEASDGGFKFNFTKFFIVVLTFGTFLFLLVTLLPCIIAPEIAGLQALLKLIN